MSAERFSDSTTGSMVTFREAAMASLSILFAGLVLSSLLFLI